MKMVFRRYRLIRIFFFLSPLFFLGGCRYRAGFPVDSYNIKTIYVKPTVKEALAAQLSGELTRQLGEEILRNGFLRLAKPNEADATLETTIVNYNRGISIVDEDDDEKAKSLSLSATCKYTLKDNRTDEIISNGTCSASVGITATTNAQAIEYQRTPQLTRSLAQQIASRLLTASGKKTSEKDAGIEGNNKDKEVKAISLPKTTAENSSEGTGKNTLAPSNATSKVKATDIPLSEPEESSSFDNDEGLF